MGPNRRAGEQCRSHLGRPVRHPRGHRGQWDQVLAVNLKGPFFLTQRVAREMLRRTDLVHPAIVNISSLSSYTASTNRGDYCVSKAGLGMVTQLFAARLAEHGISVFEVRPGIIETDMTAAVRERYTSLIAEGLTPIRRWGTIGRRRPGRGLAGDRSHSLQHRRGAARRLAASTSAACKEGPVKPALAWLPSLVLPVS